MRKKKEKNANNSPCQKKREIKILYNKTEKNRK